MSRLLLHVEGQTEETCVNEEPSVNCQERTHEELRQSLADALAEALEFNRRDALAAAGDDYRDEKVVVCMRRSALLRFTPTQRERSLARRSR